MTAYDCIIHPQNLCTKISLGDYDGFVEIGISRRSGDGRDYISFPMVIPAPEAIHTFIKKQLY